MLLLCSVDLIEGIQTQTKSGKYSYVPQMNIYLVIVGTSSNFIVNLQEKKPVSNYIQ